MKMEKIFALSLGLLFGAGCATAAPSSMGHRHHYSVMDFDGPYVGVGVSSNQNKATRINVSTTTANAVTTTTHVFDFGSSLDSATAAIGYSQVINNCYLAGELNYQGVVGELKANMAISGGATTINGKVRLKGDGSLVLKAGYLFSPQAVVYVLGGATKNTMELTYLTPLESSKFNATIYGLGLGLRATKNLGVHLEYKNYDMKDKIVVGAAAAAQQPKVDNTYKSSSQGLSVMMTYQF